MIELHNELGRALETLELLDECGQADFLHMAAIETGGYFKEPVHDSTFDSKTYEIKVHDVFGTDTTRAGAIRLWIISAKRHATYLAEIMAAENVLCRPMSADPAILEAACKLILAECRSGFDVMEAARIELARLTDMAA